MALNSSTSTPLPSVYRFDPADYSGLGSIFDKFIGNLNLFSQPVYNLLNGSLSFSNFERAIYKIPIKGGATLKFVNPISIPPSGLNVAQVVPVPVNAVSVAGWSFDGTNITVTPIGLTTSTLYSITLEVY